MRLTDHQLRALLDRYEAAETTLAEERQLRAAMAAPDLPEAFHAYRPWFGGLTVLATAPAPHRAGPWSTDAAPAAPETSREATVRTLAAAPQTPPPRSRASSARVRPLWLRLAVAAALIGLIGFGVSLLLAPATDAGPIAEAPAGQAPSADATVPDAPADRRFVESSDPQIPQSPPIDWSKYEVTDPAEARRITRAALAQVSTRLHRGSALTAQELGRMEPIAHLHNYRS